MHFDFLYYEPETSVLNASMRNSLNLDSSSYVVYKNKQTNQDSKTFLTVQKVETETSLRMKINIARRVKREENFARPIACEGRLASLNAERNFDVKSYIILKSTAFTKEFHPRPVFSVFSKKHKI